ncbi:hypothetical protein [Enterobacter cloacae]|uniref:hypothetical protein n=2 Tax=Enterobacter cloacae TaxID=550 RepID=UPI0034CDD86D
MREKISTAPPNNMTRINIYTLPQEATPIKKSNNGQFFYEMEYIQNMNISLNLKKQSNTNAVKHSINAAPSSRSTMNRKALARDIGPAQYQEGK